MRKDQVHFIHHEMPGRIAIIAICKQCVIFRVRMAHMGTQRLFKCNRRGEVAQVPGSSGFCDGNKIGKWHLRAKRAQPSCKFLLS